MPTDAAGRWTPPAWFDGSWSVFRTKFLQGVADPADAMAVLDICEALALDPTKLHRKWSWWYGVPDMPTHWPAAMTAEDWQHFRRFVETETAARRKNLTPTEV